MSTTVSPLAPTNIPDMPKIASVRLATGAAGIKSRGRSDVLLALFGESTTAISGMSGTLVGARGETVALMGHQFWKIMCLQKRNARHKAGHHEFI